MTCGSGRVLLPMRRHLHKISSDSAAGWYMGMSDCSDALRRMTSPSRYRMHCRDHGREPCGGRRTAWLIVTTRQAEGWVMADSGLFIGFGAPVRGRERQATKVFNEAFEYYSRLQQGGEIESFEPVLLEPHGGELDGFFLLRGDQDKLARIRSSEEFERLTVRGQLIIENLGIVGAALGGRLMSQMSVFGEQVEELT